MENKRKGYKTLEAQKEATKRYFENNPDAKQKQKLYQYKSAGKNFIKNHSTLKDLEEFEEWIKERKKEL